MAFDHQHPLYQRNYPKGFLYFHYNIWRGEKEATTIFYAAADQDLNLAWCGRLAGLGARWAS